MKKLVGLVMGSRSDWTTLEHASTTLAALGIPHDVRVLSAHRSPAGLIAWVREGEAQGFEVIVAAAGGAAHLAGVVAAHTRLPVLGVPMESKLSGLDSLLSTVQMPAGVPVATFAVGKAGAINAALFAAAILARRDAGVDAALERYRATQTEKVLAEGDPRQS
ncbi:MAG: 5-(carboxyamino)imidazole ribonucleotide mutase [Thermoanaerobaculia bacterium]